MRPLVWAVIRRVGRFWLRILGGKVRDMNESKKIKFSSYQISEMADILDKHGLDFPFISDAEAGEFFSEFLIKSARLLTQEQAEHYHDAI
jgi:hypothetical protein